MTLVWSPGFTQWDPAAITTALWLDAADASTISVATGVSEWRDKSGNARHASQATAANQPTQTTINGVNGLQFDGVNDVLTATMTTGLSGNYGIFTVAVPLTAAISKALVVSEATGYSNYWVYLGVSGGSLLYSHAQFNGSNNPSANAITPVANTAVLLHGWRDSSPGLHLYTDGVSRAVVTPIATAVSYSNLQIGGQVNQAGRYSHAKIGEVIITDYASATPERQRIEGYLAHKWGLTANLPNNHPYKVNPPAP